MYIRKSGNRRCPFAEDNLHFPGGKKSLLEKKRSWEEDRAGMWSTYEFPAASKVWVVTKLPPADPVKKNDLSPTSVSLVN